MSLSVSFGGHVLTKKFIVANVKRPLPNFRADSTQVAGRHGESFDDATVGTRECSFEVIYAGGRKATAQDIQDAARTLADALMTRVERRLVFSDEKTRTGKQLVRYAVPIGSFDVEEFIRAGQWKCRFKQHDPFLYNDEVKPVTLKTKKSISIGGNVPTYLTVTARPSDGAKQFWIRNNSNKKTVYFKAEFDGSAVLTLDFETGKATLSELSSRFDATKVEGLLTKSRFFSVGGTETMSDKAKPIELEASCKCQLSWRERWL